MAVTLLFFQKDERPTNRLEETVCYTKIWSFWSFSLEDKIMELHLTVHVPQADLHSAVRKHHHLRGNSHRVSSCPEVVETTRLQQLSHPAADTPSHYRWSCDRCRSRCCLSLLHSSSSHLLQLCLHEQLRFLCLTLFTCSDLIREI